MQTENPKPVKVAHSFYLPLELLDDLKREARNVERSVNWLVVKRLTEGISHPNQGDLK